MWSWQKSAGARVWVLTLLFPHINKEFLTLGKPRGQKVSVEKLGTCTLKCAAPWMLGEGQYVTIKSIGQLLNSACFLIYVTDVLYVGLTWKSKRPGKLLQCHLVTKHSV